MKVILVNGSPHERGCTDRALREVAAALESESVQTEMLWIGFWLSRLVKALRISIFVTRVR